jgi:hypothetical protein
MKVARPPSFARLGVVVVRVQQCCCTGEMNAFPRVLLAIGAVLLAPGLAHADGAAIGHSKSKLDNLLVYGQGFMFGVKEPVGWKSDTNNAARLGGNVVFYPAGETLDRPGALITVRVNGKTDENTEGDLQADMDGYRQEYANVAFEDLAVTHPSYRTFPKLFFIQGEFFEYVVYVNPGKDVPFLLSVSMNKQKTRATRAELQALQEVVRTLHFFNGVKVIDQKASSSGAP